MTRASAVHDSAAPIKGTLERVWSPQLRNYRNVDVYLPPSYATGRHPVVYLQDGQNLSDPALAFAGTWDLDANLQRLYAQGHEPIVVGVHNTDQRLAEYSPFPDPKHGGGGADAYLDFLVETLKPRIDRLFRTDRRPDRTCLAGSSMGALLSLYGWFRRPDVFGSAAVMSPSLWFGRDRLFEYLRSAALPSGKLYVDVGTAEGGEALKDVRALRRLMLARRLMRGERFEYLEDRGARHEEAAWSRRFAPAFEFLLPEAPQQRAPRSRSR